ncbi:hypothetical protein FOL47_008383 [Perkinsus chesapeaki]|uniref:Uncharacterized protein n=1 Tax=Perkinsus chesapeaki TaxID=330153 RepID=A0A7J6LEF0_PERCH|nr:hypothetical protein FOL47_008383 [Perkinsus chesapeaki]
MLSTCSSSIITRLFASAAPKAAASTLPFANLAKAEAALGKHEDRLKQAQHDLLLKYASMENNRREREEKVKEAEKRHVKTFAASIVDVAEKMNEAGDLADKLSSQENSSDKVKSVAEGKYQIEPFTVENGGKYDVTRQEIGAGSKVKQVKKGESATVDGVEKEGWKMGEDILRKAQVDLKNLVLERQEALGDFRSLFSSGFSRLMEVLAELAAQATTD